MRTLRRQLVVELVGRLERRLHDRPRERAQLRAIANEFAQRLRIPRVVLGKHQCVGLRASAFQRRLIMLGQFRPLLFIDEKRQFRRTFPPARVVIELRHLVQAEALVVVRSDPFRGVDGAALKRRIDFTRRNLGGHHAKLGEYLSRQAGNAHLQAFEIGDALDLLAVPAGHLRAGVARRETHYTVLLVQQSHGFIAAAEVLPRILLACVQAKGNGGAKGECRVLADVIVGRGMAALHGAGLRRIQNLQRRHQFTRGGNANLEATFGHF